MPGPSFASPSHTAPSTSPHSSAPQGAVPSPSLSPQGAATHPLSPRSVAPHVAVPSPSLSPRSTASGIAAGSQPSSPRYRPYTVTHLWGSSPSPTPRSSILANPPGFPAHSSSPRAVPASSSRQRPRSRAPAFPPASPSAASRRPSSLRISPRYLFSGELRVCLQCRERKLTRFGKNCCVTLTSVEFWESLAGLLTCVAG